MILPDNDAAGRKYAEKVTDILIKLNPPATVRILNLPALDEGEDIVDFIERRRTDGKDDDAIRQEIHDLVAGLAPVAPHTAQAIPDAASKIDKQPEPKKKITPNEAADDPHRLARLFIKASCQHPDGLVVRYLRDEWHRWHGTAWRNLPAKELAAEITALAKEALDKDNVKEIPKKEARGEKPPTVKKVTIRLAADVAHALASMTILSGQIDQPSWLGEQGPFPETETLACKNGLIHIPNLTANKDFFHPHTPRFFSSTCLDFDFDGNAPRPARMARFSRPTYGRMTCNPARRCRRFWAIC